MNKYLFRSTLLKIQMKYNNVIVKVKQSRYNPEVPRWFQEVKVPTLRDNDPGWR